MRELEPLELTTEYGRQLRHAANRMEDARGFLAENPSRVIDYIWENRQGERQHVRLGHQFYKGIEKAVGTRTKDLSDTGPQGEWNAERILTETTGEYDDPFAQPNEGEE